VHPASAEEFEAVAIESKRTIEIDKFVPCARPADSTALAGSSSEEPIGGGQHGLLFFGRSRTLGSCGGSICEVAESQPEHSNIKRPGSPPKGAMRVASTIAAPHLEHCGSLAARASPMAIPSFISQCPSCRTVPSAARERFRRNPWLE
jgi:hypothetical protein